LKDCKRKTQVRFYEASYIVSRGPFEKPQLTFWTDLNKDVEFLKDLVDQLQHQQRRFSGGLLSSNVSTETVEDVQGKRGSDEGR